MEDPLSDPWISSNSPHGDPLLMVLVGLLLALVTLTLRAAIPIGASESPLGGGPVSEEGKVAGVDEVLEGGQALDQVALEGVVRQQAQRRQAVDAPGAPLLQKEGDGESKCDTNLRLSKLLLRGYVIDRKGTFTQPGI